MTEESLTEESLIRLGGATWRDEEESDVARSDSAQSDSAQSDSAQSDNPESDSAAPSETRNVYGPEDQESELSTDGLSPVNIRNFSVKCGSCGNYQVIVGFRQIDADWNEYVYECDEPPCSGAVERSRTVLEIPSGLDEYARRDPTWHGGEVHAGAKHGSEG